ncbi:hypothetical protein COW46_02360 [Candidatus Gracilibacteria bacterium CG17_big_fil_post_rev_8_21_14_2_50_48_13]|nr:MAG: hypothetical protein COW46_02360 [Candidatus Gracilibacteria bacterium CG17_big_fil_post_rev_8_21_14_2_50_48_13]
MTITSLLEKAPGLLTWSILLLPLVLAPHFPAVVAVLLMLYSLFWLFQSVTYSYQLLRSYRLYKTLEENASKGNAEAAVELLTRRYSGLSHRDKNLPLASEEVIHMVLIPTYKEPYVILDATLSSLLTTHTDPKRLAVVLACEERDFDNAKVLSEKLAKKYAKAFRSFAVTFHPKDTPGEMVGKGANITYSMREVTKHMQEEGLLATPEETERYLVTTIDADHLVHPAYFQILELAYVKSPNRQQHSYQPLPFLYNNIWQVPIFNRVVAISSMFWHLIESGRPDRLRNFSSHAQPLSALMAMQFWSTTTIVEDGHQFWRSYMHFRGEYKVIPLFIPIYQDAVQHTTYSSTLVAQYKQLRRWAYGAEDIAYVLVEWWKKRHELPLRRTLYLFFNLVEGHVMWATAPVVLSLNSFTFRLFSPEFTTSAMFFNLSMILSNFFAISLIGIVISVWMSFVLLPPVPETEGPFYKRMYLWLSLAFQWFLLPITTLFFSSVPALEAQTRLMFGNKLHFDVTLKIRSGETLQGQKPSVQ